LRRFCRISLSERVPDESTVCKLTRRLGAETVAELTRALIERATREKRFRARAVRIDSTVIEADIKYPTDAGLAAAGVKVLAREGRKLAKRVGDKTRRVRDRSRALGRRLRAISRTIRRRSGEAKADVLKLTARTGELLERSVMSDAGSEPPPGARSSEDLVLAEEGAVRVFYIAAPTMRPGRSPALGSGPARTPGSPATAPS
jgi:transposase, IS5 family